MSKGISLHIGLNEVDPDHYDGFSEQLLGAANDAIDYQRIASIKKFQGRKLFNDPKDVTRDNIIGEIEDAATKLVTGDIFLLTYSGHGGQIPDQNSNEPDSLDETWCLFDGQLIDDELLALYTKFKKGVRILVISDSCHSATVFWNFFMRNFSDSRRVPTPYKIKSKDMPTSVTTSVYLKNKGFYDSKLYKVKNVTEDQVVASVKLLSACQDNQTAVDGDRNGLYTSFLKSTWNGDKFKGNYLAFQNKISQVMAFPLSQINHVQNPSILNIGTQNTIFDNQTPFTI